MYLRPLCVRLHLLCGLSRPLRQSLGLHPFLLLHTRDAESEAAARTEPAQKSLRLLVFLLLLELGQPLVVLPLAALVGNFRRDGQIRTMCYNNAHFSTLRLEIRLLLAWYFPLHHACLLLPLFLGPTLADLTTSLGNLFRSRFRSGLVHHCFT